MNEFERIKDALRNWPEDKILRDPFDDRSCEQLRRALLASLQTPQEVGDGDLAGLVRHVMRRGTLIDDPRYVLSVPKLPNWPSKKLWEESCVGVLGEGQSTVRINATAAWSASWLPHSSNNEPFRASYKEDYRRKGWPSSPHLAFDTALEFGLALDSDRFKGYQGPGQRLAIRSAFLLKAGGTLVVNLPTGTGKSLVAWSAALLCKHNELTVMITPTIALAIDQERQLKEQYPEVPGTLPNELAWHSGLSEESRKAIKQRLRANTQRILITSPESFVGTLSRELYRTAESGRLRYFVVDEAHLVAQWGNDFRPEFQSMSGMRRDLIKRCPPGKEFRTLLLSATLTQESFDVLESLFSDGDFDSVNAVALRPEPEYWQSSSKTRSEREQKVRELIRVVPRPFLLYVTTKRDAEFWYGRLREMGIFRSGCVHGGTPNERRERVIDQWRGGEIDCVVATSAFGLGMDKSDVRTVIHACIPESIDRFYQEVGRAGRDGCASISLLMPCDDADRDTAHSISQDRIISLEKGRDRWEDLINHADYLTSAGVWRVNLKVRPAHIQQDSDANMAWNLRTLVLLNRSKVIRLESQEPPKIEQEDGESESDYERRRETVMDEYFTTAHVRILDDRHLDEGMWETVVKSERDRMYSANRDAFDRMENLLSGETEIGDLLRATYTVATDNGGPSPQHTCGGCGVCRDRGSEVRPLFSHPEPDLVDCIEHGNVKELQAIFKVHNDLVFVRVGNSHSEREKVKLCLRLVQKLAGRGVDEFAIPDKWKSKRDWMRVHEFSPRGFVVSSSLDSHDSRKNELRLTRATFLLANDSSVISPELINLERPFHIIFASEDAKEAGTGKPFFSTCNNYIRDYDLVQRLGQ